MRCSFVPLILCFSLAIGFSFADDLAALVGEVDAYIQRTPGGYQPPGYGGSYSAYGKRLRYFNETKRRGNSQYSSVYQASAYPVEAPVQYGSSYDQEPLAAPYQHLSYQNVPQSAPYNEAVGYGPNGVPYGQQVVSYGQPAVPVNNNYRSQYPVGKASPNYAPGYGVLPVLGGPGGLQYPLYGSLFNDPENSYGAPVVPVAVPGYPSSNVTETSTISYNTTTAAAG